MHHFTNWFTLVHCRFDEFYFYRQGALLAADTFGSSHILPVIGLPLLVTAVVVGTSQPPRSSHLAEDKFFSLEIAKVSWLTLLCRLAEMMFFIVIFPQFKMTTTLILKQLRGSMLKACIHNLYYPHQVFKT